MDKTFFKKKTLQKSLEDKMIRRKYILNITIISLKDLKIEKICDYNPYFEIIVIKNINNPYQII